VVICFSALLNCMALLWLALPHLFFSFPLTRPSLLKEIWNILNRLHCLYTRSLLFILERAWFFACAHADLSHCCIYLHWKEMLLASCSSSQIKAGRAPLFQVKDGRMCYKGIKVLCLNPIRLIGFCLDVPGSAEILGQSTCKIRPSLAS
jgi:hypothetical protein